MQMLWTSRKTEDAIGQGEGRIPLTVQMLVGTALMLAWLTVGILAAMAGQ